jgi:hypothetical protein
MRSSLVFASLTAALLFAAPDASAQQAQSGSASVSASAQPAWSQAATPLPAALAPAAREADQPVQALEARPAWKYPAYGVLVGALVGAVAGTAVMATADEWMAPPAHILTVPAGALAGLALGGVANLIDRP